MVLSSVRDDSCSNAPGSPQPAAADEIEALVTALGPFANHKKIEALLQSFGGVRGLAQAGIEDLETILGSEGDAAKVAAILKLANGLKKPVEIDHPVIDNCSKLIAYLQQVMGPCRVETFRVLFFDTHNKVIADEVLWTGTVSEVQIYPREIMRRALELDSSAIIAVHNHPSNVVIPSRSDLLMTRKLLDAANSLSIAFHDHIIVSSTKFHSMRVHKSIDPWG